MELVTTALGFLGLNGSSGQTKSSESRLKSAKDARQLARQLDTEDEMSAMHRAIVKGQIDGNPPYKKMPAGRTWECNLNFGEGRSIMKRTAVPYYNLFARVPTYAECCTNYQYGHPDHEHWNKSISRRFHELLKRWPQFNWNVQQASFWMRLHGIGFLVPENDYSWRVRSVETGAVKVPRGSPSVLDKRIPYVAIHIPYRNVELWDLIKDEKAAEAAGANVEAIKLAIKYGMRGQSGTNAWWSAPWEKYQEMLKNHDYTSSFTDGDIVDCTLMLVQEPAKAGEYGGKISKFLFTSFKTVGPDDFKKMPRSGDEENDFLFAKPNCYDSYAEGLIPFFRDTGDGTWHSVRGYAQESFAAVSISNRLKCQMVNRGFIDSSVVLQHPTERNRKRQELAVWGAVVNLPANTELKPTTVQGGTDGVIAVDRVLSNHLQGNLGIGNPRGLSREDGRGEMPTKRQVDYQAAQEASIGEGEITIFYQQLDGLYNFIFTRAADPSTPDKEAQRFQQACRDDGVPAAALKDMDYIRANRQNGYGSPEMGIQKMEQMMNIVPMFPEDGKQNWLEDIVTNIAGPQFTDRYVPRQHIPDEQDWQAGIENGVILDGTQPIVSAGQDDVIHVQSHFAHAEQTLAPVAQSLQAEQPVDPQELQDKANYATTMAQHVEQHLGRMERDQTRKSDAKLYRDKFKQLAEFSKELWTAIRRAHRQAQIDAQQNAQATALSALDQAKVQSVQTQAQSAAAKAQSQIQIQQAKATQAMRLKDLTTAHKVGIDNVTTAHDINIDRVKTRHEIDMEKQKAKEIPSDVAD